MAPTSLLPELKNSLIAAARALREGNESEALRSFATTCAHSVDTGNRTYGRLWELMGRPDRLECGRDAFWNNAGLTAPASQKIQAIEDVLKALLEQSPPQTSAPSPLHNGAKKVVYPFFVDCGFDPRFSFNGDELLPSQKKSWGQQIREWIAYLEFTLRAYFSWNSEERALRQMLLATAKTELTWAQSVEEAFIDNKECIYSVFALEHDFLNQASQLYSQLHPSSSAQRLYPAETLKAWHSIQCPQTQRWNKKHAMPGFENGDLARCSHWGFWRLGDGLFSIYDETRRRDIPLDPYQLRYVPHYIFIHAIQSSAKSLKTAMREYRFELASAVTDPRCARSIQSCKEKLLPKIAVFHTAWQNHVNSHEALQETNALFSTCDPYKPAHDFKHRLERIERIPLLSSLYKTYLEYLPPPREGWNWREYYEHTGYETLKTTLQRNFPNSLNAQLLRARDACYG